MAAHHHHHDRPPVGQPRPMGAPADVSELEYLSALVQSESADVPLRPDGTITAIDIRRLLQSRHGLRIPLDRIEQELFLQLAGSIDVTAEEELEEEVGDCDPNAEFHSTDNQNDNQNDTNNDKKTSSLLGSSIEITTARAVRILKSVTTTLPKAERSHNICLDLVQITALLMIPELQRCRFLESKRDAAKHQEKANHRNDDDDNNKIDDGPDTPQEVGSFIDAALKILFTFTGIDAVTTESSPVELTTSVLRDILVALEEDEHVSDELLQEMIDVAATGTIGPRDHDETTPTTAPLVILNRETFLNALTADIGRVMNDNVLPYEHRSTTHYEDAIRNIPKNVSTNSRNHPTTTVLEMLPEKEKEEEPEKGVIETREQILHNEGPDPSSSDGTLRPWRTRFTQTAAQTAQTTAHLIHETTQIVARDHTHDPDLQRVWTAPSIDMVADTYKSFWWTVILWFTLVILFFSYFVSSNLYSVNSRIPTVDCSTVSRISEFACKCLKGVIVWLNIFVQLAVLGTAFILLSSFGNTIYHYKSKIVAVFMCTLGIIVTLFTTILAYIYNVNTILVSTEKDNDKIGGRYLYASSLFLGSILLLIQLANILRMFVSRDSVSKLAHIPFFAASARKMEQKTKLAAAFKMRWMINNALGCHANQDVRILSDGRLEVVSGHSGETNEERERQVPTSMDSVNHEIKNAVSNVLADDWQGSISHALYNYEVQSHHSSDARTFSILPIWREMCCTYTVGSLDGIWINPRLVASNLAQWLVLILIPFVAIFGINFAEQNSDFLETQNIKVWEVQFAVGVGATFSLCSAAYLAMVYIPSAVATVMDFRCGVIGSLQDPQFPVHRYALDQTTILYGAAFWGALFTCVILWGLTGLVAFVAVWEEARPLVQVVLATIIGFLMTLLLKLLILQILRQSWYGAFYRRKPAAVNVMNIMLECWSLGLSSGYVLARIVKLFLIAIFYIGRIDTPLLAPGIGWLFNRVPIDAFPIAFRKDLLSHEAHRHPYIERLSMLFVLKLHNGSQFGSRACAVWRIVLVRTLMPWLRKYRRRAVWLDPHDHRRRRRRRHDGSFGPSRHGSSVFHDVDTSSRHQRALAMENATLRRENIALRQELVRQTRSSIRRRSASSIVPPSTSKSMVVSSSRRNDQSSRPDTDDVFYDTIHE